MSTASFTFKPSQPGWRKVPVRPIVIARFEGTPRQQRIAVTGRKYWRYTWPLSSIGNADRATIDAFFVSRGNGVEAFYVTDPKDNARTAVSCGTGNGSNKTFNLPASGDLAGDYPLAAGFVGYVSGSPATVDSVSTDGRTFTFHTAPGNGLPVTADYSYYRLVVLVGDYEWSEPAYGVSDAVLTLDEVPA